MPAVPAVEGLDLGGETISAKCDENNGSWRCLSHNETLPNNFSMHSHTGDSETHVVAWVCLTHGPEVP